MMTSQVIRVDLKQGFKGDDTNRCLQSFMQMFDDDKGCD